LSRDYIYNIQLYCMELIKSFLLISHLFLRLIVLQVMKPYGTPETISRKVQRSGTGMLYSEDKSMQAVLEFLYTVWEEKDQRLVDHLKLPEEGCFVRL